MNREELEKIVKENCKNPTRICMACLYRNDCKAKDACRDLRFKNMLEDKEMV